MVSDISYIMSDTLYLIITDDLFHNFRFPAGHSVLLQRTKVALVQIKPQTKMNE